MWSGISALLKSSIALSAVFLISTSAHAEPIKPATGAFEILGAMEGSDFSPTLQKHRDQLSKSQMDQWALNDTAASDAREKHVVNFKSDLPSGSIVVRTKSRKLYFILGDGRALEYPVGVGREGFQWSGRNRITRKTEWPDWRPPQVMIEREAQKGHILPEVMEGGPENPLGARAMYIGSTEFRIHGTTQPNSIGKAVSSGCIRLLNEHVIDLYDRVQVGAHVVVE